MPKETFYFSHDYNARMDRKIYALRIKHKMEGVGIYWCILEMLYEEGGKLPIIDYERIAFELQTDCERIKSVIEDFELFFNDGKFFWSNSALTRLNIRKEKSEKAKKSAQQRWGKKEENANALQTLSEGNAIKERKVNENKEKEIVLPPSVVNENTLIGKMCFIWKKYNPNYQWYEVDDYPALLDIAYKIAKAKGWEKHEVVNGKLEATEKSWDSITEFIKTNDFFRKLDISTLNKKWAALYQTMSASKNPVSKKEADKPVKIVRD